MKTWHRITRTEIVEFYGELPESLDRAQAQMTHPQAHHISLRLTIESGLAGTITEFEPGKAPRTIEKPKRPQLSPEDAERVGFVVKEIQAAQRAGLEKGQALAAQMARFALKPDLWVEVIFKLEGK